MSERPICVTFRGLSGEKLGDVSIESTLPGHDLLASIRAQLNHPPSIVKVLLKNSLLDEAIPVGEQICDDRNDRD